MVEVMKVLEAKQVTKSYELIDIGEVIVQRNHFYFKDCDRLLSVYPEFKLSKVDNQ